MVSHPICVRFVGCPARYTDIDENLKADFELQRTYPCQRSAYHLVLVQLHGEGILTLF